MMIISVKMQLIATISFAQHTDFCLCVCFDSLFQYSCCLNWNTKPIMVLKLLQKVKYVSCGQRACFILNVYFILVSRCVDLCLLV